MTNLLKKTLIPILIGAAVCSVSAGDPPAVPQKAWRGKTAKSAAAGKAETFMPVFTPTSITCGNKTVTWDREGKLIISNSNGVLLSLNPHFCYMTDKKKIDWYSFTATECQVKAENGKVVWNLKKQLGGQLYDACTQTLEITPEGLLKLHSQIHVISAPGWKPRSPSGSVFIFTPYSQTEGKDLIFNGKRCKMAVSNKAVCVEWKAKQFNYVFYPDNAADTIALNCVKPEVGHDTACTQDKFNKSFRTTLKTNKEMSCTFTLDIRKGVKEAASPDTRAGIDFQKIEKLELPDGSRRNLIQNSSFERGLEGYVSYHHGYEMNDKWNWKPFAAVEDPSAPFGKHVLLFNARKNLTDDYRQLVLGINLTSQVAVVPAGTYTVSFYAKKEKGSTGEISLWAPNFLTGSLYAKLGNAAKAFRLTDQWKRYSFTFNVPKAQPLEIHMNARTRKEDKAEVRLDGLQLESGDKATAYEPAPAEGRLVTSSPENFVSAKDKIDGKLVITTAKPNMSGKAALRVRNYFGEELLKKQIPFRTDGSGVAQIKLPLDNLPGLGVFLLRVDYQLDDGSKAYEHHRYAKVDFLDNTHPNAVKFASDYGRPECYYNFIPILERWKKLGIGAKHHHTNYVKQILDMERSYGVQPSHAFMMSYLRDKKRKMIGFCIIDAPKTDGYVSPDDPRILVRDFYHDSDGTITPEYLEKFKNAAKTVSAKYPFIPMWVLAGELLAKFPPEWWSKEKTPEACARIHAQLLKAFVEGVKEGNPNAKVYQDDPCNMRLDGGIAETERLLKETNKLGVRFDVIAIHPYRFSPESPDLDSDTDALLKMLDRVGYGKVPVLWPEAMHWGPFNVPQWGTSSSRWSGTPSTWRGALLSYDMGATEKKSAAWYARAYLVVLKYGHRILGATASNHISNCFMDPLLTPYAAQLFPNTLGHVLGDAKFKKDIRFAPFIRAYVFEDAKKRPVAAVWCHLDKVDDGFIDGPVAEADFGDSLESVIDFMNSPRAFNSGKFRFPVASWPLFLRGKPGTLDQMIAALEGANVVSGEGIAPLDVLANPKSLNEVGINIRNYLSRPFVGTLNGKALNIPASGTAEVVLPLKKPLNERAITGIELPVKIKANTGGEYNYDLSFEALPAKHLPETATFKTVNWSEMPSVPFSHQTKGNKTSGSFRIGWNKLGVFIEATVKDKTFIHTEYEKTDTRWNNDCLQVYFDTMANARMRTVRGYDEDDYDYAVFPNAAGNSSIVFRYRSVEQQLGLATQAPKDNTVAPDIPSSFSNRNGVLTYRVFFPAKYLLPVKLQPGWVFGFGLYAADANQKGKVNGALTLARDSQGCWNRPHNWPAVILSE